MKAFWTVVAVTYLVPFAFGEVGTSRKCESDELVGDVWLRVAAKSNDVVDPYTEANLASGVFEFYAKIRNYVDTAEKFAALQYDYNNGDYMIFNLQMDGKYNIAAFDDPDWFILTTCFENDLHAENDPFTARLEICLANGSNCIGYVYIAAFKFVDE